MARSASQHSQRLHVGFENGLLLGALVGVLLAQTHDRAQRLDVEAVALGDEWTLTDCNATSQFGTFETCRLSPKCPLIG